MTVRADDTLVSDASEGGEYLAVGDDIADSGRKGDLDQSGIWRETSTKGSTLS